MSRQRRIPKTNAIIERVRALSDADLTHLVVTLRFNTKLEQSLLARALAEQRRRRRKAVADKKSEGAKQK